MGVKTTSFEIWKPNPEARKRWFALADDTQRMTNRIWRLWLVWHTHNDSATKIRDWLNLPKNKNGKRATKCPVVALPKELSNQIYHDISTAFPAFNKNCIVRQQQIVGKKISDRKAAKGVLSGWMAILLDHESVPSSTRSQPIPFGPKGKSEAGKTLSGTAVLLKPDTPDGAFRLEMTIDRDPDTGKSITETIELRKSTKGGLEKILWKISGGAYKFCGSSLSYERHKKFGDKKWFAQICWQSKETVEPMQGDKIAVLCPMRKRPWLLWVLGSNRKIRVSGDGREVIAWRRQLLMQRWNRQSNYRHAGSATKGHGRDRALLAIEKLQQRWKDAVKTRNHVTTSAVVSLCKEKGVGTLIYLQPAGAMAATRFLSTAGKVESRHDGSSWDWFQVRAQLGYKCQDAGIAFTHHKFGDDDASSDVDSKTPDGTREPSGTKSSGDKSSKNEGGKSDKKGGARKPRRKPIQEQPAR